MKDRWIRGDSWGDRLDVQLDIVQVPAEGSEDVRLRVMFDNIHVGDVGVELDNWRWIVTHQLFSESLVRKFGEQITLCIKHNEER